ncbi:MAG: dienelactone hydrolase [Halobacteriovorax sp.]|nr:dienelactone hydrolase [Halobacteriovorax sp.]
MKILLPFLLMLAFSCAHQSQNITYKAEGKTFNGYLAKPRFNNEKRPAVIVVHEWWGQNEYARMRADMLAKEGYVALALDMYGNGEVVEDPKSAGKLAGSVYSNMKSAEKRFAEAMKLLKSQPEVDADKIAAIGYCFGGAMVLHMARAGMDLDGVISYHGNLKPQNGLVAKKGKVKAKVLAFNGAADPFVPKEEVAGFKKEMKLASVDYRFIDYKGALHAFTNQESDATGKKWNLPVAYDERADQDSWAKSLVFLRETLR